MSKKRKKTATKTLVIGASLLAATVIIAWRVSKMFEGIKDLSDMDGLLS